MKTIRPTTTLFYYDGCRFSMPAMPSAAVMVEPQDGKERNLVAGAEPEKFSCIEEIEEQEGTGREQQTLYLVEHRPA